MRVKLRVDSYTGPHVAVTFFAGEGETLHNIGTLRMRVEEYQAIGCAIGLGAERMGTHLQVIHDDEVFLRERDRRAEAEKARSHGEDPDECASPETCGVCHNCQCRWSDCHCDAPTRPSLFGAHAHVIEILGDLVSEVCDDPEKGQESS